MTPAMQAPESPLPCSAVRRGDTKLLLTSARRVHRRRAADGVQLAVDRVRMSLTTGWFTPGGRWALIRWQKCWIEPGR
jgi:hypothetical protein